MLRTDDNPDGLPLNTFDDIRAGEIADRSQLYRDLADGPFFGHNRNNNVSQGFVMPSGCRAWHAVTAAHTSASPPSRGPTSDPT